MTVHGTRTRYGKGCRCDECAEANRAYVRMQSKRARRVAQGKAQPTLIDCGPARDHLQWLSDNGIGMRTVADLTGLSRKTVHEIRCGDTARSRPQTVQAILGVGTHVAAPGTRVDATRTWRLIDELVAHGFTKGRIAAELGSTTARPALQLSRRWVTARNARKVAEVHARLLADVIARREQDRHRQRRARAA